MLSRRKFAFFKQPRQKGIGFLEMKIYLQKSALGLISVGLGVFVNSAIAVCRNDVVINAPNDRFIVRANGTVFDIKTKLTWKQCVEGLNGDDCSNGAPIAANWKGALDLAASSTFAGFNDWRLPNVKELMSIVEKSCFNPAINTGIFPGTPTQYYIGRHWTSTVDVSNSFFTWNVDFYYGYPVNGGDPDFAGNGYYFGKNGSHYLRLVRGE
jgi:Protein of unknown function (DUF1566)